MALIAAPGSTAGPPMALAAHPGVSSCLCVVCVLLTNWSARCVWCGPPLVSGVGAPSVLLTAAGLGLSLGALQSGAVAP